ncbi:alpha/beta fold hydrolase [Pontivivens insulae]|uniref:Lipase 1 n=1 Tax=Pontivivens insulae TaxID=1639689 RepID=A0A2R8AGE6_9RHOB|nr:alpha/beta hydrolase [Pontivivens insulae]RED10663.1 pimeloyl-ACP methyl ester carboxylesterase [Pontivivens insulae]SPF31125.1 Lipase 1 [Pontivivens insulae]
MKRLIKIAATGVVGLAIALVLAWNFVPHPVARLLIQVNNTSAGLEAKTVSTPLGDIHYLEGGTGETVLLLHGIYARKEHWIEMARPFVEDYHVVLLDLPGFGDNAKLPAEAYALETQMTHLTAVMDALDLGAVHIGANSMGAYVASLFAAEAPDRVTSLAFIGSPLGVPTSIQSDMDTARAAGDLPLVVQTEQDFLERNEWLSPQIPYVPGPILTLWMQAEVAAADHNLEIWDVVHHQSQPPTVLELAPTLAVPALVLWCNPDRIFHISGAEPLVAALRDAELRTMDNCGHLPMLDQPRATADIYLEFLQSIGATEGS